MFGPYAGTCDECGAALEFAFAKTGPGGIPKESIYLCPNRGEDWHSVPDLDEALDESPSIDEVARQIDELLKDGHGNWGAP